MFYDDSFYCAFCVCASPSWRGVSFSLRTYGETPKRDLFFSAASMTETPEGFQEKRKDGRVNSLRGFLWQGAFAIICSLKNNGAYPVNRKIIAIKKSLLDSADRTHLLRRKRV
jgi:hypothetical protein